MRTVTRISYMRSLGVYRDFTWPQAMPDFRRYNVIYGWNGSGKTLLSRVFSSLQHGQKPPGDVALKLSSGEEIRSPDFQNASSMLSIRVFNRDFVDQNVYMQEGPIGPIYILGEKPQELQQELDDTMRSLSNLKEQINAAQTQLKDKERESDGLCSDGASEIRDTLAIPGRRYERNNFRSDMEGLIGGDRRPDQLSDLDRQALLAQIHSEPRKNLFMQPFPWGSVKNLLEQASAVCSMQVVASVIEQLRQRPDVNVWAETGLDLHRRYSVETCLFCGQPLPIERLRMLEQHFSGAYKQAIEQVDALKEEAEKLTEAIGRIQPPDEQLLYPGLRESYADALVRLDGLKKKCLDNLGVIGEALERKRADPFENLASALPAATVTDEPALGVEQILAKHNEAVSHHDRQIREAKDRLKLDLLAKRIGKYRRLDQEIAALREIIQGGEQAAVGLESRRSDLEKELFGYAKAAEALNEDIAGYLGHSELRFEVQGTGYRIVRNGQVATTLSDGEKTAIAFLYFLKSLEDKDFDIQKGIVVIDDPVSSLDAGALYYAFGFMKDRVKEAGQLFIFTHNFQFFKQVRHWFHHAKGHGFYMTVVRMDAGQRKSSLAELDPLLEKYETEYHYLFSLVCQAASSTGTDEAFEWHYHLPNTVRRLVEAFIEFKVPGSKSPLRDGLDGLCLDPAKRERIRRFCNTYSHSRTIPGEDGWDPAVLMEARAVAADVMELIESADPNHYHSMVQLVRGSTHG